MCWGIITELYTDVFADVIDSNSSYARASLYSTVAMSVYTLTAFMSSSIVATLSDSIGRKPILLFSVCMNAFTGIVAGLCKTNWVFITVLGLQGLGYGEVAAGDALIADYQAAVPVGWTGCSDDDIFHQYIFSVLRRSIIVVQEQLPTEGNIL